jgi:hypothetical protein
MRAKCEVSGELGCADPAYLRQFEQFLGMKVFRPDVPGASMGVTGPDNKSAPSYIGTNLVGPDFWRYLFVICL